MLLLAPCVAPITARAMGYTADWAGALGSRSRELLRPMQGTSRDSTCAVQTS